MIDGMVCVAFLSIKNFVMQSVVDSPTCIALHTEL